MGTAKGGGVIAPVGETLLFEHNKISATRGGGVGDLPCHHHPGSATAGVAPSCVLITK